MVKLLWDQDTASGIELSVLILGSFPWLVQKGLTESLAGRFEVIPKLIDCLKRCTIFLDGL